MAYVFAPLHPARLKGCNLSNSQPQIEYAEAVTAGETAPYKLLGEQYETVCMRWVLD
jgi:hypothetical protein